MNKDIIFEAIEENPIIMALKDEDGVKKCLENESKIVFILYGDICNISDIVKRVKAGGKKVIVHTDLVSGLGSREVAVDFLVQNTGLDGIITTKPALVKRAKELGLFAILRCFILDSLALTNIRKQVKSVEPDMIEILPGVMPKITSRISQAVNVPIICGGLVADKEDVMGALSAGAIAISTTNYDVWDL